MFCNNYATFLLSSVFEDGVQIETDSRENVYCCAQGGIHIFNKNADYLGIIKVPEQTGNCAFGGPDMDILYLAASTTLYSFRIKGRADKNGRKILNGQGK